MRDKRAYRLVHDQARHRAAEMCLTAPDGYVCVIQEPTRSLDQNAAMWPILEAFSRQLMWPVNGEMTRLEPDEWKQILSAAFCQEQQRVSPGLNGGMVLLGQRTSRFGKREFSEFIDFLHATAVDRGVSLTC